MDLLSHKEAEQAHRRLLALAAGICGLLLLAGLWSFSPIAEWLDPRTIGERLARFRGEPWAVPLVFLGFVLTTLAMLPITLMVVLTTVAFGPWLGLVISLFASTLSGALCFGIGRALGHRHVLRLTGGKVARLSKRIAKHGFLTIALMRTVPVAHFAIVSLAAGVSHIRFASFILGTFIGMAPGMALIILFVDRLAQAALQPDTGRIILVLAVGGALVASLLALRHWLIRRKWSPRATAGVEGDRMAKSREHH